MTTENNIAQRYNGRLYIKDLRVLIKSEAFQRQLRELNKLNIPTRYPA